MPSEIVSYHCLFFILDQWKIAKYLLPILSTTNKVQNYLTAPARDSHKQLQHIRLIKACLHP